MIDLAKKFFGKTTGIGQTDRDKGTFHDIRIATCALLLEMANIDGKFSAAERKNILAILNKDHQLSDEYAEELIKASNDELHRSVDLWRFTNLINRNYSIAEKIRIIEMVWGIAYTDGKLDKYEDYLVHKLAKLLHLTHKQLIEAKLRVFHGKTSPSTSRKGEKGDL